MPHLEYAARTEHRHGRTLPARFAIREGAVMGSLVSSDDV